MKTNRIIYFLLIIIGATIMATGDQWIQKEYSMSIGIVLLMFGIYKSSKVWSNAEEHNTEDEQ
ncbi:hypothetical protein [uncultured Eudoraea sp.]|uniref:hypothetical protein n=1 Tax=uncultured Eudoraea sp. TaxID=1035614 RepID=UPI0026127482|nr:hypothetical protein [uncultured Eudoraea sp.]